MANDAHAPLLTRRVAIALVGPLPPQSGGMANQTLQLARLLREGGVSVDVVQVNAPYRPPWIERFRGVRALFRSVPYVVALWQAAGRVDLFHVMANSGWAWHFFAAPAIWTARLRGIPVIVNYRGGEAEVFLRKQFRWILPSLARASAVVVPSAFLQSVFAQWNVRAEIVPNIVDLSRFVFGAGRPHAPRFSRIPQSRRHLRHRNRDSRICHRARSISARTPDDRGVRPTTGGTREPVPDARNGRRRHVHRKARE